MTVVTGRATMGAGANESRGSLVGLAKDLVSTAEEPKRPQPWQRVKGESIQAHAAFRRVGRLPLRRRSIAEALRRDHDGKVPRAKYNKWKKWSARFDWQRRFREWDEHRLKFYTEATDDFELRAMTRAAERIDEILDDPDAEVADRDAAVRMLKNLAHYRELVSSRKGRRAEDAMSRVRKFVEDYDASKDA